MLENDESAIAIGKRLKHLRLLAGINRYELAEKANINKSTLSLWENAKSVEGKPTNRSITKLLNAFKEAGVVCNEIWLLTGTGIAPVMVKHPTLNTNLNEVNNVEHLVVANDFQNTQTFENELKLFLKNKGSVIYKIKHNFMYPIFRAGDMLGGIWQPSTISDDEKICIINIDNNLQVRRVRKSIHEGYFNVSYLTYDKDQIEPFEINNVSLLTIAPIIRVWRKES